MIDSVYTPYLFMVNRNSGYKNLDEIYFDLFDESTNPKMVKRYITFISSRKNKFETGKTEKHHILPKCLFEGRVFGGINIINLTLREHFIAHLLLLLCFPDNFKLKCAIYSMCPKYEGSNSRIYEKLKRNIGIEISQKRKNYLSSLPKEVLVLRCKKAWETRRKNGTDRQSLNLTPKGRQSLREKSMMRKGEKRDFEAKKRIALAHIGIKDSEMTRKKKSESAKRAWALRKI